MHTRLAASLAATRPEHWCHSPVDVVCPHLVKRHLGRLKPFGGHLVSRHRLPIKRRHPEHCTGKGQGSPAFGANMAGGGPLCLGRGKTHAPTTSTKGGPHSRSAHAPLPQRQPAPRICSCIIDHISAAVAHHEPPTAAACHQSGSAAGRSAAWRWPSPPPLPAAAAIWASAGMRQLPRAPPCSMLNGGVHTLRQQGAHTRTKQCSCHALFLVDAPAPLSVPTPLSSPQAPPCLDKGAGNVGGVGLQDSAGCM